ncbi:MAG TPA: HlyD family type I secretion periplasmic adaptor subunit [Stellaceae bacterium]|nr:HlyD family type I secretion periplasmic adaptor subunit [Stellaceae bacterium]
MSVLPFRKGPPADLVERQIDAFESETQEVVSRINPHSKRAMLYALFALLGTLFILSCVIKIDRIATAPGLIVPLDGTVVVQPLETAIIHSLRAHVGDTVKKGQVLATLDPTFAAADLSQLQQKRDSLVAETARLQAENDGVPFKPTGTDPYQSLEAAIWNQRQAEYKSSINDFNERTHAAESSVAGIEHDMEVLRTRLGLAGDIEHMRTELEKKDVGSRLNSLLAQDSRLQDLQSLQQDEYNLAATKHNIESLKSQRDVFEQQWKSAIGMQLVDSKNQLDSVRQYLTEAEELRGLADLTAPTDAIVLDVAQLSVGSVAQAGNPVFTLVPLDATLEAEIQVSNLDIGFIRPGDPVILKFDSFPYIRHGVGHGTIKTVSEDSFTQAPDGSTVPAFFKARVTLTNMELRNVPKNFRVLPGMTMEGDIIVGQRRIISYLTESTLRTGLEGMREP